MHHSVLNHTATTEKWFALVARLKGLHIGHELIVKNAFLGLCTAVGDSAKVLVEGALSEPPVILLPLFTAFPERQFDHHH